jgi:hypothetical protein
MEEDRCPKFVTIHGRNLAIDYRLLPAPILHRCGSALDFSLHSIKIKRFFRSDRLVSLLFLGDENPFFLAHFWQGK